MNNHRTNTRTRPARPLTRRPTTSTSGERVTANHRPAVDELTSLEVDARVLVEVARNMRSRAYAPYSHYLVGAALLTAAGRVYGGCNVENAAYGMSICAERSAVVKAVGAGEREFDAIAVVTEDGGTPCGACRQVLSEFGGDTAVIIADNDGHFDVTTVDELLPHAFRL